MLQKSNIEAFTVREILFLVIIIAVIFGLTAPSLVKDSKIEKNLRACQKAKSSLSQAMARIEADKGTEWFDKTIINTDDFWKVLPRQLNYTKICEKGDSGCFPQEKLNPESYSVRTADGICYKYTEHKSNELIGVFTVDADCESVFDVLNKDIFFFGLTKDKKIIPLKKGM